MLKFVSEPCFEIGCGVKLAKDTTQEGIIEEMHWYYKDEVPIYYLSINGRKK
ncbi:hypothetical protein [Acetivibrio mesophilus]|uniref:hypothetical protein n=1 Tax=Acetivibrio mesophilus TaxID=2487273 RepID=UPI0012D76EA9|nr:hypothetical protein [Acetivibrio mesophilus]